MTTSEQCARVFLQFYKGERRRAEACLDDVFDLLMDGTADLTTREAQIVDRLMTHWTREPQESGSSGSAL